MSQPKAKAPKKRKERTWVRWMLLFDFGGKLEPSSLHTSLLDAQQQRMNGPVICVRITEVLPK